MPRIPYVTDAEAGDTPLVAAIRRRRGGGLLNLDRELLHSPSFAEGWNALLGKVRGDLVLDPKLRELAMCIVAVLNGADYEFIHHAPEFIKAGGTQAQVSAVRRMDAIALDPTQWSDVENATIALTMQMTRIVEVEAGTFESLRRHLDDRTLVELVGVVATYNMVSRFLVALDIQGE